MILISCLILLAECKRYPEGGFNTLAFEHLTHNAKVWELELYEVDGIDSTNLINGVQWVQFVQAGKLSKDMIANNSEYHYSGIYFSEKKQSLEFHQQGYSISSTNQREILNPENREKFDWKIVRLKRNKLALTSTLSHKYRLEFYRYK